MGNRSLEFEIKVALTDTEDVSDLLGSFKFTKRETVIDVYYDTNERHLFKRGIFLRLRNSKTLEFKYNSDVDDLTHLSCHEYKYEWPLDASAKQLIAQFLESHLGTMRRNINEDPFVVFQLKEFVRIVKDRSIYSGDGIELSLDDVTGLGKFLEIEAKGVNGVNNVTQLCSSRCFSNVPLGYVELWLRNNDFDTYSTGKYVLKCDRRKRP